MNQQEIYKTHHDEIYFFLLKKMKDRNGAENILQNTFLKAFENYHKIRDKEKIRAWLFQIARNEMVDYYKKEGNHISQLKKTEFVKPDKETALNFSEQFCCFDTFLNELPEIYRKPVNLVYKEGKKQTEAAEILKLKLPTVKMRIRRAKNILVKRFHECCHYEIDSNGKLFGEQNCPKCNKVL